MQILDYYNNESHVPKDTLLTGIHLSLIHAQSPLHQISPFPFGHSWQLSAECCPQLTLLTAVISIISLQLVLNQSIWFNNHWFNSIYWYLPVFGWKMKTASAIALIKIWFMFSNNYIKNINMILPLFIEIYSETHFFCKSATTWLIFLITLFLHYAAIPFETIELHCDYFFKKIFIWSNIF